MRKHLIHIVTLTIWLGSAQPIIQETSVIGVRNAHTMAYHSQESQVYLFGGANEKEVLNDLWVLDNKQWRKLSTSNSPAPRTFSSLIYDEENNRLLLFGGNKVLFGKGPDSQTLLNDTWQFKDNKWTKINTNNAPIPRSEATMAYDSEHKRLVLFGGYTIKNGEYEKLGDTWEFYDNDWHLASNSGPSNRSGAIMTFDHKDKSIVLFGGSTIDRQYGESKGETWKWKNQKWAKFEIEQPPGAFNSSLVSDKSENELIRFGGWNGKSRISETWMFKNNKWTLKSSADPSPRNHSSMVYDSKNKRIILFGGHDGKTVFGDTWEYVDHSWRKLAESPALRRVKNKH